MAMEYWGGWFDHWGEQHHTRPDDEFRNVMQAILDYPASVNIYMFHGGTNFGFMNGANVDSKNVYEPDTSSYDYDAPLTEAGDYTNKYVLVKEVIRQHNKVLTKIPLAPTETTRKAYPTLPIGEILKIISLPCI